jgi:hypothetical protein
MADFKALNIYGHRVLLEMGNVRSLILGGRNGEEIKNEEIEIEEIKNKEIEIQASVKEENKD